MKLVRLELERFTAFEHATFDFSSGVNVIIGENGTGKSHVLKLIYCLSEAIRRHATGEGLDQVTKPALEDVFAETLAAVFQPDDLGRLVRRGVGRPTATIRARWAAVEGAYDVELALSRLGKVSIVKAPLPELERSIFLPTREVLSIFPGFISSYVKRESAFDRTIYDLCLALDAKPLRGAPSKLRANLLGLIESELGGKVINDGGRFYLALPDGRMEAPLMAEGLRKLGMVDYLLLNGSLADDGFLLWDEPEASLNPKLTRLAAQIALGLARANVQTWVATHDYLLTSELTLAAERPGPRIAAFFALSRSDEGVGSTVEYGDKLADLQHNSILQAFADLHGREESAFVESSS